MGASSFIIRRALIFALFQYLSSSYAAPADDISQELFLTPLIKSGELDRAKAASMDSMKLSGVKSEKEIKSYSGYLTIDENKNSNLFFWFFPAQKNPEYAPVILWINDIPGYTCLKGVFLETGPFQVDDNNKLVERNFTWTRSQSMLYIDAPVGSGFSFADSGDSYANDSNDEANELYQALTQFFTLFNEFQPNDFYLAGEAWAGTFMPYIGNKIHAENANAAIKINLKGMIMGGPFLDTSQVPNEDFYYSLGLISAKQKNKLTEANNRLFDLHNQGKDDEALVLGASILLGPDSVAAKMVGFEELHNALTTKTPPAIEKFKKFIESKEAHNYLHAGLHKFISINQVVFNHFAKNVFKNHTGALEEFLDKDYKVLIYSGQFDLLVTPDKVQDIVFNLKWKRSAEFATSERKVWRVKGEVAGYYHYVDKFAYTVVRNAGRYAIMDQPEWATDLVEEFMAC